MSGGGRGSVARSSLLAARPSPLEEPAALVPEAVEESGGGSSGAVARPGGCGWRRLPVRPTQLQSSALWASHYRLGGYTPAAARGPRGAAAKATRVGSAFRELSV